MKKITNIILILVCALSFFACEDVVDIQLNTAPAKLVIDASILWKKGTSGNEQTIKLTTTTDFYAETVPVAGGAIVFIKDENGTQYDFIETPGTGNYSCVSFNPVVGQTYELTVIYEGETYKATEQLVAVPPIDTVAQNNEGGFTGTEIEVTFFFEDEPVIDNFYLIQFNTPLILLPEYDVVNDAFFQGNQMFGRYSNETLKAGDVLHFTLHGISARYYNYMNILLDIAGGNGGSPFQTPPATVRGNISNQTHFDNYALGYFRLSEIDTMTYTVE